MEFNSFNADCLYQDFCSHFVKLTNDLAASLLPGYVSNSGTIRAAVLLIFCIPVANRSQFTDELFHLLNCSVTDDAAHTFSLADIGPRLASLGTKNLIKRLPKRRQSAEISAEFVREEVYCREESDLFHRTDGRTCGPKLSC